MSHDKHCWMLVNSFVEIFNEYRVYIIYLSHLVYIDQSIYQWYGHGGESINIGLPMYVAIYFNPNNRAEIKDKFLVFLVS